MQAAENSPQDAEILRKAAMQLKAARDSLQESSLWSRTTGGATDRALANVHEAEVALLRIAPQEELRWKGLSVLVQARSGMPFGTTPTWRSVCLIEFIGLFSAAVAGAVSLRRVRGSSGLYHVATSLLLLRLPVGALTAVIGIILLSGSSFDKKNRGRSGRPGELAPTALPFQARSVEPAELAQ
ncbi:hypothetical protein [Streptomyces sp. Je 1-332]|uniref:hypothetical protein n=1 Tax=Streptomyces sp. Je 1-332 TaxID=3231270 RepID=UPI00345828B9